MRAFWAVGVQINLIFFCQLTATCRLRATIQLPKPSYYFVQLMRHDLPKISINCTIQSADGAKTCTQSVKIYKPAFGRITNIIGGTTSKHCPLGIREMWNPIRASNLFSRRNIAWFYYLFIFSWALRRRFDFNTRGVIKWRYRLV